MPTEHLPNRNQLQWYVTNLSFLYIRPNKIKAGTGPIILRFITAKNSQFHIHDLFDITFVAEWISIGTTLSTMPLNFMSLNMLMTHENRKMSLGQVRSSYPISYKRNNSFHKTISTGIRISFIPTKTPSRSGPLWGFHVFVYITFFLEVVYVHCLRCPYDLNEIFANRFLDYFIYYYYLYLLL